MEVLGFPRYTISVTLGGKIKRSHGFSALAGANVNHRMSASEIVVLEPMETLGTFAVYYETFCVLGFVI